MRRCVEEIGIPTFANSTYSVISSPLPSQPVFWCCLTFLTSFAVVIEGGQTENLSAKDLAELGFCAVAYPWTLVAAKLKSIRETLEDLKKSMTVGAPPMILSYSEVCEGVGFNKYWVSRRLRTTRRFTGSVNKCDTGPRG